MTFLQGIYTKTMTELKKERTERSHKSYEARHKRDAVKMISVMLAFGLLGVGTFA